jgi:hypothetical protein
VIAYRGPRKTDEDSALDLHTRAKLFNEACLADSFPPANRESWLEAFAFGHSFEGGCQRCEFVVAKNQLANVDFRLASPRTPNRPAPSQVFAQKV